jgi:hypothetical protein
LEPEESLSSTAVPSSSSSAPSLSSSSSSSSSVPFLFNADAYDNDVADERKTDEENSEASSYTSKNKKGLNMGMSWVLALQDETKLRVFHSKSAIVKVN